MGGNPFTSFPVSGVVGGWVELARTTLGSPSASINVGSLADKRYYMVLHSVTNDGQIGAIGMQLNGISTNTYAYRQSSNGGADSVNPSVTIANGYAFGVDNIQHFSVEYWANLSAKEKLGNAESVWSTATGSAAVPNRHEMTAKHVQTSNPITAFDFIDQIAGDFATGSEMVVLGWDPADVHTNNFWEELYSVDNTGTVASKTSDTFTAKKYLWVQMIANNVGTANNMGFQFNSDTGSNYSLRGSGDGAADITAGSQTKIQTTLSASTNTFLNAFIINNSANEKLWIGNAVGQLTAGAGNAPKRWEHVAKWTNTASQITSMTVLPNVGNIDILAWRIWGSN